MTATGTKATEEKSEEAGESALERSLAEHLKWAAPLAVVIAALVAGWFQGPPATVLVLAGGALVGVIVAFWASGRTLLGETPLSGADAYALGAPRAEEEKKRAVLRALKDLEFEKSVGKISEEDYQALVARYRAEAKRLLQLLETEASPARARAELLAIERLRREGLAEPLAVPVPVRVPAPEASADDEMVEEPVEVTETRPRRRRKKKRADDAAERAGSGPAIERAGSGPAIERAGSGPAIERAGSGPAIARDSGRICNACSTKNDADAAFCKRCGSVLRAEDPA